jgi:hypothetical protein
MNNLWQNNARWFTSPWNHLEEARRGLNPPSKAVFPFEGIKDIAAKQLKGSA